MIKTLHNTNLQDCKKRQTRIWTTGLAHICKEFNLHLADNKDCMYISSLKNEDNV